MFAKFQSKNSKIFNKIYQKHEFDLFHMRISTKLLKSHIKWKIVCQFLTPIPFLSTILICEFSMKLVHHSHIWWRLKSILLSGDTWSSAEIKNIFFYDDARGNDGCLQNKETIFDCLDDSLLIFTCCHVDVPFCFHKDFRHTGHVLRLQIKRSKVGREIRCISPLGLPLSTPFIYICIRCERVSQNEINRSFVDIFCYQTL